MNIVEFAEKLGDKVPDRFYVIMAFEEARMYSYKILKFHMARNQEVSLVIHLKDLDSDEVEVLGVEVTLLKERISGLNANTWKNVRDELLKLMISGESFYAEDDRIFKLVIRTKSLNVALEKLYSIVGALKKLNVDIEDKFIGYSFKEEEILE